jgi:hypothetical protein
MGIDKNAIKKANKRIKKVQKGQPVFRSSRPIRKFIQLVKQSNDFCLLPPQAIDEGLSASFLLTEFSTNPIKTIYIKEDGNPISFLGKTEKGKPRKLDFCAIQKINHGFINPEGFSHDWRYVFGNLLFDFINLKTKTDLEGFIEKTEFSVFPTFQEFNSLMKKYSSAGVKRTVSFRVKNNGKIPVVWDEEINSTRKKIEKINFDFIWDKKERLFDYVKKLEAGDLMTNNILFLNEQMENVSDSLVDEDAFYKKDVDSRSIEETIEDTRKLEEIIGSKKMSETNFLVHYRVYGHFAACCFELFLKIMQKQKIAVCKNPTCQRYFAPKRKGHSYCGSRECNKWRNAERSRKRTKK